MTDDKKLEIKLFKKAQEKMQKYAHLVDSDFVNIGLIGKIAILEWELYQKYRTNNKSYHVSKREFEADLLKIEALEERIIDGERGSYKAREQAKEAKGLLYLVAFSRIRQKEENRVY